MRYKQIKQVGNNYSEWIQPRRKNYLIKCCDCGLVHRVDFRIIKNGRGNFIQFRAKRK